MEKNYSPDILVSKRLFETTDKNTGEKMEMYECYTVSKEPLDDSGYFVKHFYAKKDKVADVAINSAIAVRYSQVYKKFYAV